MGSKGTAPPDQSAAMISMANSQANSQTHQSDNMHQLGMTQIGASMARDTEMFLLSSTQIQANSDLGHERNDLARQIAEMSYDARTQEQSDKHDEKMEDLRVKKHAIDVEAKNANKVDTSNWTT